MRLPCRNCSSARGELPLTSFTTATKYDTLWSSCVAQGADLMCFRCARELGHHVFLMQLISCDDCQKVKLASKFTQEMHDRWRRMDQTELITCKQCTAERSSHGRPCIDRSVRYTCAGESCSSEDAQQTWPESHFLPADLTHAEWRGVNAKCARCQVRDTADPTDLFKCNGCGEVKHLLAYSAICCRQFLQGERRAHMWRCMDCQFPKCKLCDARPEMAVSANHMESDGSWYCMLHRYPPCRVCRITPRSEGAIKSQIKFRDWVCATCQLDRQEAGTEVAILSPRGRSSERAPSDLIICFKNSN